jgi:carboxylate-amine ligase
LATWRASKSAVAEDLIHPLKNGRCPARSAVGALLKHVGPVLAETGDLEPIKHVASRIVRTGTGADRQRAVFARHSKLSDVVFDAVRRTHLPVAYL